MNFLLFSIINVLMCEGTPRSYGNAYNKKLSIWKYLIKTNLSSNFIFYKQKTCLYIPANTFHHLQQLLFFKYLFIWKSWERESRRKKRRRKSERKEQEERGGGRDPQMSAVTVSGTHQVQASETVSLQGGWLIRKHLTHHVKLSQQQ